MFKVKKFISSALEDGTPRTFPVLLRDALKLVQTELKEIANVKDDEIALLIVDPRGNLRFHLPRYLENAGAIPYNYSKSFVTKVIQSGKPLIDNRFANTTHLNLFEEFKRDNPNQKPIQKMLCIPLRDVDNFIFGAIELSRKGLTLDSAGPDWNMHDADNVLNFAEFFADGLFQLCKHAGLA